MNCFRWIDNNGDDNFVQTSYHRNLHTYAIPVAWRRSQRSYTIFRNWTVFSPRSGVLLCCIRVIGSAVDRLINWGAFVSARRVNWSHEQTSWETGRRWSDSVRYRSTSSHCSACRPIYLPPSLDPSPFWLGNRALTRLITMPLNVIWSSIEQISSVSLEWNVPPALARPIKYPVCSHR